MNTRQFYWLIRFSISSNATWYTQWFAFTPESSVWRMTFATRETLMFYHVWFVLRCHFIRCYTILARPSHCILPLELNLQLRCTSRLLPLRLFVVECAPYVICSFCAVAQVIFHGFVFGSPCIRCTFVLLFTCHQIDSVMSSSIVVQKKWVSIKIYAFLMWNYFLIAQMHTLKVTKSTFSYKL